MRSLPTGRRTASRIRAAGLVGSTLLVLVQPWLPVLGKLETWREEGAATLRKAKRERVVVSDSGRVRLGQTLEPVGKLATARVWDLARGPDGSLYAATGDEGKVFRLSTPDASEWTLLHDAGDSQVLAVAVGPGGKAVAGTGPSGQVVDLSDPKHPASKPHPDVQYIWDLAFDAKGNLYAATGPTGQFWKRGDDGKWSLLLDSKHPHLLCLAVGTDGAVYAGSDGEGLIYKVEASGKVSVVYDAAQTEVRALVLGPDGSLYAGTASESGSGSGRGPGFLPNSTLTRRDDGPTGALTASTNTQDLPKLDAAKADRPSPPPPSGGSATPKPISPGENAVYRIDRDGVAREVFRAKALVFALASQGERLLIGTGPEGQLYEVRDRDQESAPLARLDNGHVLSLLAEPGGGVLAGTADPGGIVRLAPGYVARGTLTSEVRDTKLISRFGALSWRADQPEGTSVRVQVRSGNVSEPDATWSDWSPEQADAATARAQVPPGRFVQYRASLTTRDPKASPELLSVSLRYQSANLRPEITKLEVPDVSALDGATKQTRLTLRWDVTDPNDDELAYNLLLRRDGWPAWVKLNEQPLSEKSYNWDTTAVPSGSYRVKVVASDRPSNNPESALERERVSESFLVDHEAPEVAVVKVAPRSVKLALRDKWTRVVKAAYAIDGGEWTPVFADDGLFDTAEESVTIDLPGLKPGTHLLVVRATDAAGNLGAGDTLIETRAEPVGR